MVNARISTSKRLQRQICKICKTQALVNGQNETITAKRVVICTQACSDAKDEN